MRSRKDFNDDTATNRFASRASFPAACAQISPVGHPVTLASVIRINSYAKQTVGQFRILKLRNPARFDYAYHGVLTWILVVSREKQNGEPNRSRR